MAKRLPLNQSNRKYL